LNWTHNNFIFLNIFNGLFELWNSQHYQRHAPLFWTWSIF